MIGLPDEKWGERVHAVVVLHDGARVTEQDLIGWCAARIARFNLPRSISFVSDDEIPHTATGKVQHRLLRDRPIERMVAA